MNLNLSRLLLIALFLTVAPAYAQDRNDLTDLGPITEAQKDAEAKRRGIAPGETIKYRKVEREAVGKGGQIDAKGTEVDAKAVQSAPNAKLPGAASADGGSNDASGSAWTPPSLWANPLLWIGVLLLAGAVAAWKFGLSNRSILTIAGAGAGLIACAVFPWLLLFVCGGVALALAWPLIVAERKAKDALDEAGNQKSVTLMLQNAVNRHREAVRAVAAGVSDLGNPKSDAFNEEAYKAVKRAIGTHAENEDRAVINEVKRADGLA